MKHFAGLLACVSCAAFAAPAIPAAPAAGEEARHAFDFLHGEWTVHNRRLTDYSNPDSPWESFTATNSVHALPGGIGNYDEYRPQQWRPGFVAMTLRVFDPVTGRWSIYWLTNRDGGLDPATGMLAPPVVGRFEHGEGVFYGEEQYKGRTAKVRFTWLPGDGRHARWEQAFSFDQGATWRTNWIMEFTRAR